MPTLRRWATTILAVAAATTCMSVRAEELLTIQSQGSFTVGGTVITMPGGFDPTQGSAAGQTFHGDHAYVFYQIPVKAHPLPIVMWHGAGQFSKSWETTADGREGLQALFLRRNYSVYLVDQPRRGNAGRSTIPTTITPTPNEQTLFNIFRIGEWPSYFPDVRFARDPNTLDQFFRSLTPNTGPFDVEVTATAISALFDKIGPGILVTHSQSSEPGWRTAIKNSNVRAIVAFEPGGSFPFPEGELPPVMPSSDGPFAATPIPMAEFAELTKRPIIIYYGDNIPETPVEAPGRDRWRVRLAMARLWRDAINHHGGDVTLVHLPEIGIRGNTHFPFSDTNNSEIAGLMAIFLHQKRLD